MSNGFLFMSRNFQSDIRNNYFPYNQLIRESFIPWISGINDSIGITKV